MSTIEPTCKQCNDTHRMWHAGLERDVMCTSCPTPCQQCRQGGNGPYCTTTPCACACHSKGARPSNIEPTEEQKQAAASLFKFQTSDVDVDDLARLLAEREAQLREELHTERTVAEKALAARNDMENERDAARRDLARANGYLLAGQKSEMAMKGQLAEARARVAELEAREKVRDLAAEVDTGEPVDVLLMRTLSARVAELETQVQKAAAVRNNLAYALNIHEHREAQHLADIKALRPLFERVKDAQFENYEDAYRAIYKCGGYDLIKQADAVFAHYDDAKADAPVSTEGGEG